MAVTSINAADGGVKIQWVEPSSNGEAISAYKIEIQHDNGNWIEETTTCSGSSSTVIAALSCVISMNTLTSTYGLLFGEIVAVRVSAYNINDWSATSDPNVSGASIKQIPIIMS